MLPSPKALVITHSFGEHHREPGPSRAQVCCRRRGRWTHERVTAGKSHLCGGRCCDSQERNSPRESESLPSGFLLPARPRTPSARFKLEPNLTRKDHDRRQLQDDARGGSGKRRSLRHPREPANARGRRVRRVVGLRVARRPLTQQERRLPASACGGRGASWWRLRGEVPPAPGSSRARCWPGLPAFCPSWGLPASPSVCTRPPSNTAQRTSLLLMCKCKHWWGLSVRPRKDATVPGHLLPRVDHRLQEEASSEPRLSAGKQVPTNNSAVRSSVPECHRPRKMGTHHGDEESAPRPDSPVASRPGSHLFSCGPAELPQKRSLPATALLPALPRGPRTGRGVSPTLWSSPLSPMLPCT